ncbi:cation-translocating P-type ATPase [Sphingobacterium faecium]|uniref:cation-translocating P-type ATPase n=1 Tax=Sphingobacterium faecium TaxID=34087 RepID=UPI00097E7B5B|nr:cation-translocating P-type ATPase [Sphingobacterium faecium]WGQ14352.1 cation-translocating P-type ATPase [Sphingobacterium faecium]SJN52618.1 Cation transport ATPase [Sphingobacterium faecium PCAi_F2.5]
MGYPIPKDLKGLNAAQVRQSVEKDGYNSLNTKRDSGTLDLLLNIVKEPMLILLIVISVIYLIVGNYTEAYFMLAALTFVSGISFYQDVRSQNAMRELEKLNEPLSKVIRDGQIIAIKTHEIAVGDLCITEEGQIINADGIIVHSHDFSVNESSLTGESLSVFKDANGRDNCVYSGTITVSGLAVYEVKKIGQQTKLGQIGQSMKSIKEEKSPLQLQIERFVKNMALIGLIVFMLVCLVSYFQTRSVIDSLLSGLTLAMSILPEEIPVAFTTFMALGAWKLMREGVIIKKSSIVETLGSTTVICTDKTGTITENTMNLVAVYSEAKQRTVYEQDYHLPDVSDVIQTAMWASEPVPFDPMEKELHQRYEQTAKQDRRAEFELFHEYPLEGKPPMMTHLFRNDAGDRIIAAKGAPEAILEVSSLSVEKKEELRQLIVQFGQQGYRVLGVAKTHDTHHDFPEKQQDFQFDFEGFVVFYDPPKKGIEAIFKQIYEAGIKVKMITGDNSNTATSIAQQAGLKDASIHIDGKDLMLLSKEVLDKQLHDCTIFARMYPEAKLAVIQSLKRSGEVVAMLGDGVNDAPALKAAHIGVAMGNKGTEIAKAAAAVVLVNDDFSKLVVAIAAGRRIYANIKKAIQYIISIHIPIILTVSLPLFLGWIYPQIFTPIHVIFLELVMGPTCSIVYENEPMEPNAMQHKPRPISETFLNWKELTISMIQGLVIAAGVLFIYQYAYHQTGDENTVRSMVFTTLIFSNILLSFINRSFYYYIYETITYKNNLIYYMSCITLGMLFLMLYFEPVSHFFSLTYLNAVQLLICLLVAGVSTLWMDAYKYWKRSRTVHVS